jgi:cation transport ATPase
MTCSACTSAVEGAVSARRGVRRVAVSLLQNRARVVFDPALVKVRWRGVRDVILPCVFAPAAARLPALRIILELLDAFGAVIAVKIILSAML